MRSRASFKGHPIHPALIPFPLAFLTGAFFFDLAGKWFDRASLWTTGGYLALAGVITGLLAAVPGTIDLFKVVPPNSSGKRRAQKHAIINVTAVAAFAIAWLFLRPTDSPPGALLIAVEALGVAAISLGGWLGGTLVTRNQIGIDHRYAGAGKWHEQHLEPTNDLLVMRTPDLKVDQMMLLHAGNRRIVLAKTENQFVAFDDHCTHRGGTLADGVMMCGTVQCPWHGSQFDVHTGKVKAGPASAPIKTYTVEHRGQELRIRLKSASQPDQRWTREA
jgi:nitrite reductase/ring-hydroxylating ferredoxin subunit/uncharacterized membrane protein